MRHIILKLYTFNQITLNHSWTKPIALKGQTQNKMSLCKNQMEILKPKAQNVWFSKQSQAFFHLRSTMVHKNMTNYTVNVELH